MIFLVKSMGGIYKRKLLEISEYFAIPTIPRSSSFDDEKRIVGIVKKNKKKKIRLYLPPMLLRNGLEEKPILLNLLQSGSFKN
jgi:hypothetical protein